ncbi:MAG: rhodanese-like domain-containing protein [Gammaproteobacteria bacterium]
MFEFTLFVFDNWYLSLPFFIFLILYFSAEMKRGGKRLSCIELTHAVNKDNAVLVDVRDREDFEKGHITNAINIPYKDFDQRLEELNKYQDSSIITICAMGRNAALSAEKLQKQGFKKTYVLKGGLSSWLQESLPLVNK